MEENSLLTTAVNCGGQHSGLKVLTGIGLLAGGSLIGTLGTQAYNRKRYSKERRAELLLLWLLKNVRINVNQNEAEIRIGVARLSFDRSAKKDNNIGKESNSYYTQVDDEDIDIQ
jgi:hypothetical protein